VIAVGGRKRPTILVTDAGRGSALSIVRSLGRGGFNVVAGDSRSTSLAFRTRYAAERLLYPDPTTQPREFVQAIIDAVARFGVDLVIPVTDSAILPLSIERDRLGGVQVAMPDPEPLRMVINKRKTIELGVRLGIPAPRSVVTDSVESARRVAEELGWPVVLKPKSSRIYRDQESIEAFEVSYANSLDEVTKRVSRFEGRCDVLVQEYVPGSGHGIGLLMHEGRPLAAFQHRRLHEVPLSGGASSLRESVALDPVLYDHSVRLLAELGWTGLAMVEYKVGPRGARLMEVNGRVWGSLPLAVMSGVDFPRLLAELHLEGPPPRDAQPQLTYRVGVRARNLDLDLIWIASALSGRQRYPFIETPGRGEALAGILGLLDPRCGIDNMSLDDPGLAMAEIPAALGRLLRKLRKSA
jgi:predicted ATP-grasp superfamily ATP-dependent carboligase